MDDKVRFSKLKDEASGHFPPILLHTPQPRLPPTAPAGPIGNKRLGARRWLIFSVESTLRCARSCSSAAARRPTGSGKSQPPPPHHGGASSPPVGNAPSPCPASRQVEVCLEPDSQAEIGSSAVVSSAALLSSLLCPGRQATRALTPIAPRGSQASLPRNCPGSAPGSSGFMPRHLRGFLTGRPRPSLGLASTRGDGVSERIAVTGSPASHLEPLVPLICVLPPTSRRTRPALALLVYLLMKVW